MPFSAARAADTRSAAAVAAAKLRPAAAPPEPCPGLLLLEGVVPLLEVVLGRGLAEPHLLDAADEVGVGRRRQEGPGGVAVLVVGDRRGQVLHGLGVERRHVVRELHLRQVLQRQVPLALPDRVHLAVELLREDRVEHGRGAVGDLRLGVDREGRADAERVDRIGHAFAAGEADEARLGRWSAGSPRRRW